MINDFSGMNVLVTGGTKGIGLATGLEFARLGARCFLTYAWGSVEESEILAAFEKIKAATPRLIQADVIDKDDNDALFRTLSEEVGRLDVLVSNVAMGTAVDDIADYDLRAVGKSIQYSAWPLVDYVRRARECFSVPPRYVIAVSAPGTDHFYPNYDMVSASKAVVENWTRYLTYRLFDEDCRINAVRTEWVDTESGRGILGPEGIDFARQYFPEGVLPPEATGKTIVALCSGLMDAVRGQVITVDRGGRFYQNAMYMYDQNRFPQPMPGA